MSKTATIICLGFAMAGISPAFGDSGKQKDKSEHGKAAHGAPAAHAQVARQIGELEVHHQRIGRKVPDHHVKHSQLRIIRSETVQGRMIGHELQSLAGQTR